MEEGKEDPPVEDAPRAERSNRDLPMSKRLKHTNGDISQRVEEEVSWRALVIRLGERCQEYGGDTDPVEHLAACVSILKRHLAVARIEVVAVMMQCAEELPHKAPLYATLAGLLCLEEPEVGAAVVGHTYTGLQAAVDTGERNKLRLLLRFLSLLAVNRLVTPATLLTVLCGLVDAAGTILALNPCEQARGDFYVYAVLAALPFAGATLEEGLEGIMDQISAYMAKRASCFMPGWQPVEGPPALDYVEDLLLRIQTLQTNSWTTQSVLQPQTAFPALANAVAEDVPPLLFPPITPLPPSASAVTRGRERFRTLKAYPPRVGRVQIFPAAKTDDLMAPIERWVVEEYLLDALFYLNGCRKECAAAMVGLAVPFRYEYVMAETVFSQLLLLPHPPFKAIFYTIVMVDLCKALPGAFPAVVAAAVRALFQKLPFVDVEARVRLQQWLSHHLSNFGFVWPWDSWSSVLSLPLSHPQRLFCAQVLEHEIRLSYWDKVKESLGGPKMALLLPPKPTPRFKYSGVIEGAASPEAVQLSADLKTKIRAKTPVRDLQVWLEGSVVPAVGPEVALDLTVQTLLDMGAKSFTHTLTALERYGPLLRSLAATQLQQEQLVEGAVELWANSCQMAALTVDRCMGLRMVSNRAIAGWVFRTATQKSFHTQGRAWEVLRNAVTKTSNRTSDLRKETVELKKQAAIAVVMAAKAKADADEDMGVQPEEAKGLAVAEWAKREAERAAEQATAAQEAVEAKEALLGRAVEEQEAFLLALISHFATALTLNLSAEGEGAKEAEEAERMEEGERREWVRCTMGHLQSICRWQAAELWSLMERIEKEVLTSEVDPRVIETIHLALGQSPERDAVMADDA